MQVAVPAIQVMAWAAKASGSKRDSRVSNVSKLTASMSPVNSMKVGTQTMATKVSSVRRTTPAAKPVAPFSFGAALGIIFGMARKWPTPEELAKHAGRIVAFNGDGVIELVADTWTGFKGKAPDEHLRRLMFLFVPQPGVAIVGPIS